MIRWFFVVLMILQLCWLYHTTLAPMCCWTASCVPCATRIDDDDNVAEHSSQNSSIGKHMFNTHRITKPKLINDFSVLKKCRSKFDCLIIEMLIIQDLKHIAILYNEAERLSLSVTNPNEMISLAGNWSQLVYLAWRDSNLPLLVKSAKEFYK